MKIDYALFVEYVLYLRCTFLVIQAMRMTVSNRGERVQLSVKDGRSIPYWNIVALGCAVAIRLLVLQYGPYAYRICVLSSSLLLETVVLLIVYERRTLRRGNRKEDWRTTLSLLGLAVVMTLSVGLTYHPEYLPIVMRG